MFLFGSNGGGEAFAFDNGSSPPPIVAVPFIAMELCDAIPIVIDFQTFLEVLFNSEIPFSREVLDHFAGIKTADGLGQPGFAEVLRLVAKGNVYVKLSAPYRASKMQPRYEDVLPFAKEFVAARPDRMVWASDWPHTGSSGSRGNIEKIEPFQDIDDAHVLGMLSQIASDAATHRAILVDNPARLFGF